MGSSDKTRNFEDVILTDGEIIEDLLKPETNSVIGEITRKQNNACIY